MHNTLLRSFAVRVRGMSICLLFTLLFASVSVAQTQVTCGAIQPSVCAAHEAAVPGGAVRKVGDNRDTLGVTSGGQAAIELVDDTEKSEDDQDLATQEPDPSKVPPRAQDLIKRWGLSLHAGASIPQGSFNNFFDPGPNLAIDLEYRINTTFSLEGIYGFHRFRGETIGAFTIGDVNLHQFSLNGKVYGGGSPTRPFFNFGGGGYRFDPGSTHGGLNIGGGVQHDLGPNVAVEGVYNFHNVFTSGSNTRFSTVQGGVRFRF